MENNYLVHHGIKGQRWGIRRFQNEDGTLTNAGKKRYSFKERAEISGERMREENRLRNKYLNESAEFKKYSKLADDFEEECIQKYGFRPGDLGIIYDTGGDPDDIEYGRQPRTDIERRAAAKYVEYSDRACEAAKVPNARAKAEADKLVNDKYGKEVLKQIQTDEKVAVGAAVVASLAMVAAPFVLVNAGVHGVKKLLK